MRAGSLALSGKTGRRDGGFVPKSGKSSIPLSQNESPYGKDLELEIYEGMAKWAEIQYAYLINEVPIAKREEIITA
ncbi:MAG: hypothetical protein IJI16_03770, partial [Atopobiaceae bacterium]|nr:hypothetical protein [Atopobiaceae bacterium]